MPDLTGRVAIVTGAGQGIGRGVALALATAGASIVAAGRTAPTLEDACFITGSTIMLDGGQMFVR